MRKKALPVFLFMVFTCNTLCSLAQGIKSVKTLFPESYLGEWQGNLWYYKNNNSADTVAMKLNILSTKVSGEYSWQLIYGANEKDNHPYILKSVDAATGKWIVDENNGIKLNGVFKGGRFIGAFAVEGNIIVNSYYLVGDELHIEFYSFKQTPTGKTGNGTDDSPYVDLFDIRSFQKGVLKKKL
jgi:hypothetical protein